MNEDKLLKQIGELIDTKLKAELKPIKEQLDTVEMKVEVVNSRVNGLSDQIKKLGQKIKESQEDTIEALSSLIHAGYNMHEERIINIENHLNLTPPPQK